MSVRSLYLSHPISCQRSFNEPHAGSDGTMVISRTARDGRDSWPSYFSANARSRGLMNGSAFSASERTNLMRSSMNFVTQPPPRETAVLLFLTNSSVNAPEAARRQLSPVSSNRSSPACVNRMKKARHSRRAQV